MFVAPPSPPVDHSFFDFSALFASHDFFLQPGPQHTGTDTALDSPDERRAQTTRSVLGSFSELLPLRGVLDRARSQTPTIKMKIVETIAIPIIQEFFSSVEPSEKETLDVHFKALEACLPTLDEALHNAKLDDPALARSLSTIVLDALPQGSKELAYSQFLIDIRRLLNRLKERPGIVLSLVLPILRSVLAQNSSEDRMTPLQGWELIGELRFLLDKDPLSIYMRSLELQEHPNETAFSLWKLDALPSFHEEVGSKLRRSRENFHRLLQNFPEESLFSKIELKARLLPIEVAKALLSPENGGTLNLGLLPHIKNAFLSAKDKRDDIEQEISEMLRQYKQDRRLADTIEALDVPSHPVGNLIVRLVLNLHHNAPITTYHTRLACLGSSLTMMRQKNIGNCGFIAPAELSKKISLLDFINDFQSCMLSGTLRRTVCEKEYVLKGLLRMSAKTEFAPLQKNKLATILAFPVIQEALKLKPVTVKKLSEIMSRKKAFSFNTACMFLQKKGVPQIRIDTACLNLEAITENFFTQFWVNTAINVTMLPLIFPPIHHPSTDSTTFSWAIASTFLDMAEKIGDNLLIEKFKAITNHPCLATPYYAQKYQRYPGEWIRPYFAPRQERTGADTWVLCIDSETGPTPIQDKKALGELLIKMFQQIIIDTKDAPQQRFYERRNGEAIDRSVFSHEMMATLFQNRLLYVLQQKNMLMTPWVRYEPARFSFGGASPENEILYCHEKRTVDVVPLIDPNGLSFLVHTAKKFRSRCGTERWLSANAKNETHSFRLLFNHPDLAFLCNGGDDAISALEKQARDLFNKRRDSFPSLKFYEDAISDIAEERDHDSTALFFNEERESSLLLIEWLRQKEQDLHALIQRSLNPEEQDQLITHILHAIVTDSPEEALPLLVPFADTNYFSNGSLFLHMWFNPLQNSYEVIIGNPTSFTCASRMYTQINVSAPSSQQVQQIQQRRSLQHLWHAEKQRLKEPL